MYETIDGRNLRDGTLVSTAAILRGDTAPFDVETVSLRIRTDAMTVTNGPGITDRLDVGVAIPFVRLNLQGERFDTYRGQSFLQATGAASASGLGDIVGASNTTYIAKARAASASRAETRFPTGDETNLLGAGELSFAPRVIGSVRGDRVGIHGEIIRASWDLQRARIRCGADGRSGARFTVVGELFGRRVEGLGRLSSTTVPHPRLIGVDTVG